MAMMGDLADASLADLLFLLSTRRRTGHLIVQARGDEVQLHLTDGRVMLVRSSNSSLRLGRTLLRLGFITHERLREALREQENVAVRRSLGSILTAHGWLSPDELGYCVEDQAIAIVAWIVGWERGSFIFTRTEDSRPPYPLDLPADLLLIEATRRWDEIERLRTFLPPLDHRLIPGPHLGLFAETLGPAEAALVKVVERTDGTVDSVIDGLMTIDELAAWRTIISLRERGVLASVPAPS
ncbi:MAG TPA: DUF4388 domain-containing protein [Thermomicrobiales bacterium]|nr:DUF4388 domain-containing protein [Thermomicrobiales bacterium]